jgi:hypothetical protein
MKTLIVDCYGTIFDPSFFGDREVEITEADQYRLKYENPTRSLANQQSSIDYLKAVETLVALIDHGNLYLVGTNGEVLSARQILTVEGSSFSNPVGYINTVDKFNFAKEFLVGANDELTIITDQYYSQVYQALVKKHGVQIKIHVIERLPLEAEIPDIEAILKKHGLNT